MIHSNDLTSSPTFATRKQSSSRRNYLLHAGTKEKFIHRVKSTVAVSRNERTNIVLACFRKKTTFFFFLFLFARSILVSASPHNHDWVIGARFGDNGCINIAVHARGQTRVVRRVVLAKQTRTSIDSHTFLHLPRRGKYLSSENLSPTPDALMCFSFIIDCYIKRSNEFLQETGGGGERREVEGWVRGVDTRVLLKCKRKACGSITEKKEITRA